MLKKKRGNLKPHDSSIVIDIRYLLESRDIRFPYAFLRQVGIPNNSLQKIMHGTAVQVNMRQLTALCTALNCTPNHIFALRNMQLPQGHALNELRVLKAEAPISVQQWLAKKSIEEITKMMEEDEGGA